MFVILAIGGVEKLNKKILKNTGARVKSCGTNKSQTHFAELYYYIIISGPETTVEHNTMKGSTLDWVYVRK